MKKIFKNNYKFFLIGFSLIFLFMIFFNTTLFFQVKAINDIVKGLGFKVNDIIISGNNNVSRNEIINKIKFNNCDNLFCIDLDKSKADIEKNNWIKIAKLKYGLPSKLIVNIEEETPLFILKNNVNFSLLNSEGRKIDDLETIPNIFSNLLILNGTDAEKKVYNLLNIFSKSSSLSEKIKEATLVSKRRWSLKHSFDITIELPENNAEKAFYKIVELEEKYGFLNEKIKKIDLRVSDRMIIQLKNKSNYLKDNDV